MRRLMFVLAGVILVMFAVIAVTALQGSITPVVTARQVDGGDAEQGRRMIQKYGCGSCHTVPGVRGARGRVGPVLRDLKAQSYIAGKLPNTVEHLVRWIQFPQQVDPGNAMPDLNVTEADARDIASYLYTIGPRAR